MWILFGGGICTVLAGAMVGGWASDLFVKLGWQPLIELRNTFMLFDPLSSPLLFIGIALGLGFIHMLIGIMIEVVDCFRNGQPGQAVFANLTWFILLPGILLYFIVFSNSVVGRAILEIVIWSCIMGIIVASSPEGKAKPVDQLVWAIILLLVWVPLTQPLLHIIFKIQYQIQLPGFLYYALIPLVLYELLRFKQSKGVLGKIAWGFYNLYGISSYLSVILSYVRLMALGLVTGVIGMAINTIAWMLVEIPVIGIIFTVLVLIGGHLFNIAVNVLGGFIHTMRLQYIEFFGRFYAGGSKPFKPFSLDTKYVHIE
jgi:vacuolar-type H+-ATPase subunit I/STV1